MKVGFHAPLPPAPTGVADYAATLLSALRHRGRVEVNPSKADIHLYHAGNNQLHKDIYNRALVTPGVVVLHDAVLHHLLLGTLDERGYVEEFVYNYGEWKRDLALELWRSRSRSAADPRYFQHAMLRRIGEASRAVVVHNPAAAEMVAGHAPAARIVEIPHLFSEPALPAPVESTRLRAKLGLHPESFLFGVFGYLRESKRLSTILRAFRRLRTVGLEISLLVAGDFVSSDLARAVGPLLQHPHILRFGYTSERAFWKLASITDACINLRHPAAGETSGIAVRLMGIGKPVILSDGKENSRFLETACLRVPAGVTEQATLAEYMTWLARFPDTAREIGRRGEAHIRAHHMVEAAADAYWDLLIASAA